MKYITKGTKKGTIICIHGNSSSAKVFQEFLNADEILQTKIAFDLNGHGENQNENQTLNDFSFESQKNFLLAEIAKIDDDILLIGNSLGGHLAIDISREIKNLKGLVIMGTPPVKKPINFEEAFLPVEALNTFFTENPSDTEIQEAIDAAVIDKTKSETIISDFKNTNFLVRKAVTIDVTENNFEDQYVIFTELNSVKYIIAGDKDPSVNREYLENVKDNCTNNCKIIDFENCGHYPSADSSNEFIKTIKAISEEVFK